MGGSNWQHALIRWSLVILAVAITLHVVAALISAALPTIAVVAVMGGAIWAGITIARRSRDRW
jgi:hypothetical protein